MKKLYNFLAVISITFNLLVTSLVLFYFGTSKEADLYMLSISIFASIQLISYFPVQQFLFFYNDIKADSKERAYDFFHFSLYIGIIFGFIVAFLFYVLGFQIVTLFASGLDLINKEILVNFLSILSFGILVTPMDFIIQRIMNAERHFAFPYILQIVNITPSLFIFIYFYIYSDINMYFLIYTKVFGMFLSLIFSLLYLKKINIPIKLKLQFDNGNFFIKNSISMRFGHNIYAFLFSPITNSILTYMPTGTIAIYYYAQKIASIIKAIIIGPAFSVYQSNLSKNFSNKYFSNIVIDLRKYLLNVLPLFVTIGGITYAVLPFIFKYITIKNISLEEIEVIQTTFLLFLVWYFMTTFEGIFVSIINASKQSLIFIKINSLFIISYFLISIIIFKFINSSIYYLLIATIISQFINTFFYYRSALKFLCINSGDFCKKVYFGK